MEAFTPVGMARLAPSRGVFSGMPVVRIPPNDLLAEKIYSAPGTGIRYLPGTRSYGVNLLAMQRRAVRSVRTGMSVTALSVQ